MQFFFKIAILFFVFSKAFAQYVHPNDLRRPSDIGLKGNVKFVKKRSYFARTDSGKIVKGPVYRGTHFSDDFTYEFDETGKVITWTEMDSDKTQEARWTRAYKYDSLGRITQLYFGSMLSFIYKYDSLSRLSSVIHVGNYGSLDPPSSVESFFYNKKGQLIKKIKTDYYSKTETGKLITWYKYDVKGRIINESGSFTNSTSIHGVKNYKYNNKLTITTEETKDHTIPAFYQKFDSTGKILENWERYTWADTYYNKEFYTYNEYGNVVLEKGYLNGKLNSVLKYDYEYDAKGNWTKMVIFLNDKPHCIHLREIIYH